MNQTEIQARALLFTTNRDGLPYGVRLREGETETRFANFHILREQASILVALHKYRGKVVDEAALDKAIQAQNDALSALIEVRGLDRDPMGQSYPLTMSRTIRGEYFNYEGPAREPAKSPKAARKGKAKARAGSPL